MPNFRDFRVLPKVLPPPPTSLDHGRLMALVNSLTDGVLALNQEAQIVVTNSSALGILDANNINGRQLSESMELIDKAGNHIDLEKMILASHKPFTNRDWRLKYTDGSLINLYLSISPVKTGFGATHQVGYVMILRDITAEKTLEEERNEFISVASHELRTPIAVAEGSLSNAILLANRTNASDTIKQTLSAAYDQILFLSNLINDLSTLSRAERGKLALNVETFSVADLLNSLENDYKPQALEKGLQLTCRIQDPTATLTTSRLYVREILQNFITNSLKYTEKGSITISASDTPNGVEFGVADTGIGVSQSEQAKLFSKFFRSEDQKVRKISGTGLGLYVADKLTRLLGAELTVKSELNRGSVFKIFVPNIKPEQNEQKPVA